MIITTTTISVLQLNLILHLQYSKRFLHCREGVVLQLQECTMFRLALLRRAHGTVEASFFHGSLLLNHKIHPKEEEFDSQ